MNAARFCHLNIERVPRTPELICTWQESAR